MYGCKECVALYNRYHKEVWLISCKRLQILVFSVYLHACRQPRRLVCWKRSSAATRHLKQSRRTWKTTWRQREWRSPGMYGPRSPGVQLCLNWIEHHSGQFGTCASRYINVWLCLKRMGCAAQCMCGTRSPGVPLCLKWTGRAAQWAFRCCGPRSPGVQLCLIWTGRAAQWAFRCCGTRLSSVWLC